VSATSAEPAFRGFRVAEPPARGEAPVVTGLERGQDPDVVRLDERDPVPELDLTYLSLPFTTTWPATSNVVAQ